MVSVTAPRVERCSIPRFSRSRNSFSRHSFHAFFISNMRARVFPPAALLSDTVLPVACFLANFPTKTCAW
jgi:hypothetical protein